MRSFRGIDNHLLDRRQDLGVLRRSWQKTQAFPLKYCNRLTAGILGTALCFWQNDVLVVPTRDRSVVTLEWNLSGKFHRVQHISNTFTNEVRVLPRNRRQKTCTVFSSRRSISDSALSLTGGEAKRKKSACTWTQHLNQPSQHTRSLHDCTDFTFMTCKQVSWFWEESAETYLWSCYVTVPQRSGLPGSYHHEERDKLGCPLLLYICPVWASSKKRTPASIAHQARGA